MTTHSKKTPKANKIKKAVHGKKLEKIHEEHARSKREDKIVTIDRRKSQSHQSNSDRRQKSSPPAMERQVCERRVKVNRRRQIDPTTCERDYSSEEIEFMNALDEYKRTSGRMFPTCSEVLEVIRKLGYEKQPAPTAIPPIEALIIPEISPPLAFV